MEGDGNYGKATDIWSLGIIFLEILAGDRIDHLIEGMKSPCKRKSFPKSDLMEKVTNKHMKKIIKRMLSKDPEERYDIKTVVQKIDLVIEDAKKPYNFELQ